MSDKNDKQKERSNRIGIDARFYGKAGPGRYAKNIIKHLEKIDQKNKYFILLRKDNFEDIFRKTPIFKKSLLIIRGTHGRNKQHFFLKF
jgi:hypothetical protein